MKTTIGGESLPTTTAYRGVHQEMQDGPVRQERPRSELTQIRALVAQGVELREDQRAMLRASKSQYVRRQVCIYIKGGREAEWKALAAAKGDKFSAWIQDRVVEALSGPGPRLQELTEENDGLRDDLRALRGVSGKLAVENERLGARIEALETDLMEAMAKLLRIMERDS